MSNISLSWETDVAITPIPNKFIDKYMTSANGEYVKIYIYILKCLHSHTSNISISSLADRLEKTDNDIIRALKYWEKQGLLALTKNESGLITSLVISDLEEDMKEGSCKLSNRVTMEEIPPATQTSENKPSKLEENKEMSIKKELDHSILETDAFRLLANAIETYFGRPISHSDEEILLNLHDGLGLPYDLIEFICFYAVERQKTSLRYVEAVAIDWLNHSIKTVKDAENYIKESSDIVKCVMKAFGLQSRNPATSEMEYIFKWTDTFGFDNEIIISACNRTIEKTHTPSFKYADAVLSDWHKNGVISLDDISRLDEEHANQIKNTSSSKNGNSKQNSSPKTKFHNFSNDNPYDYDALAKKLFNHIEDEEK